MGDAYSRAQKLEEAFQHSCSSAQGRRLADRAQAESSPWCLPSGRLEGSTRSVLACGVLRRNRWVDDAVAQRAHAARTLARGA
jgi:hypothetical protein